MRAETAARSLVVLASILTTQAGAGPLEPASCRLYVASGGEGGHAGVWSVDPRSRVPVALGDSRHGPPLRGLAVQPGTQALFGVGDGGEHRHSVLYGVDGSTGARLAVGSTGFDELRGLAFRPTDGTLWSWAHGGERGLVQLDPRTGHGVRRWPSSREHASGRADRPARREEGRHAGSVDLEELAWNDAGTLVYGTAGGELWALDPAKGPPVRVRSAGARHGHDGLDPALLMRPDGQLLRAGSHDGQVRLRLQSPADGSLAKAGAFAFPCPGCGGKVTSLAWPSACGNPSPGGSANLIGSVRLDRTSVCEGEEVLVQVDAVHPEGAKNRIDVQIAGKPGASRYLQFFGAPGPRRALVTASTRERYFDSRELEVVVRDCGPVAPRPRISAGPSLAQDQAVVFDVEVPPGAAGAPPGTFEWSFGDGAVERTVDPSVEHDYSGAVARDQPYTLFQAAVTVARGDETTTLHKTVAVWNMYAWHKQRGVLEVPVQQLDRALTLEREAWTAGFSVSNPEDEAVVFDRREVEIQTCDGQRGVRSQTLPAERFDHRVGPRSQAGGRLELPLSNVPANACGVAVRLIGRSARGLSAYARFFYDLPGRGPARLLETDPDILRALNDISARRLAKDPDRLSGEEATLLRRQRRVKFPVRTVEPTPFDAGPVGQWGPVCKPGATPPQPDLTCQATSEWTLARPRIVNAQKGDVLLGVDCGMIGTLLRTVTPPQRYSHAGIMTEDYEEVRNSTASAERLKEYAYGGGMITDGLREDALRWQWPGTITQSIEQAFDGQILKDPDGPKSYTFHTFAPDPNRCSGDADLIYPRVVKPVPGSDPSVRQRLRAAADTSRGISGHYRFYGYSDGSIAGSSAFNAGRTDSVSSEGPPAGWQVGTRATVCSAFVRQALKDAGAVLEGPVLEPADYQAGGAADALTPDGLYTYDEHERLLGGQFLYDTIYAQAYDQAGWFGAAVTDAPDDLASQIVNCFASDACTHADTNSNAWRTPGPGHAVSPDNILLWDAPANGGVYGYSEPMVYRTREWVRVYRWAPSAGQGVLRGHVFRDGSPQAGAVVQLGDASTTSTADGSFLLSGLHAGSDEVSASRFAGGVYYSAKKLVQVPAGGEVVANLYLKPPPDTLREVLISGTAFIVDYENLAANETYLMTIFEARHLDPFSRTDSFTKTQCVGGEVRLELAFNLKLEADDHTVTVKTTARLYEGTGCDTQDLEDTQVGATSVPKDVALPVIQSVVNSGTGGGDSAAIWLLIKNGKQL